MSRLPFFFIISGMVGFFLFHALSIISLTDWMSNNLRGPNGWFHVHLFVLGWATMLAMGAVYQLINVILQSKIYSERLGYVHYIVFTIGLAGLLYGFISAQVTWIALFATFTFIGILLFAFNMAVTLFRASQWNAITISAALAVFYLVLTGVSGMLMGINFAFGLWNDMHGRLFGTHIWLGTIGWFGLLITGFSYKMLPMFYLSHNYPEKLQKVILLLWNGTVIAGVITFLLDINWMLWIALILFALAVIVYNVHLLQIKKHRHKKNPGTGIKWSMYGNQAFAVLVFFILIGSFFFTEQILDHDSVRLAGWVYLGGWVSFTILCYASKIVPFLWWTHKYGNQIGKPGTPVMSNLLNEQKVNLGLTTIAFASLAVMSGLLFDAAIVIAVAGVAYSILSVAYISLIGFVFAK